MKKLIYLIVLMLVLGLIVSGCNLLVPPVEKDEATILTKAPKVKPPSGAHYNLNIIGKKSDWNAQGSFDNSDRHTMFVPENTDEFELTPGNPCYTPMGTPSDAPSGANYSDPRPNEPGITIWMTKGDDFAVLDGNAFDDCKCEFQLDPGTYDVWIVAKAKPGPDPDGYYTDITGWVRYIDPGTGLEYVANDLGFLKVTKKEGWQDATKLFTFEGMWLFEYLDMLLAPIAEGGLGATDTAYFWQYDNQGNKLVKVRFYKR